MKFKALIAVLMVAAAQPLVAQAEVNQSYIRAVGEHFELPAGEARILAEWQIPVSEIPVVLLVAQRAGISPDAAVSARRGGRPWADLASRYGLDASHFHVVLETPPSSVETAYASYNARSRAEWPTIRLEDVEIIFLANVRFLSAYARVTPQEAADVLERTGSGPAALRALAR